MHEDHNTPERLDSRTSMFHIQVSHTKNVAHGNYGFAIAIWRRFTNKLRLMDFITAQTYIEMCH